MHTIDKELMAKRFQRARETYIDKAKVQNDMADKLLSALENNCHNFQKVLELACGTGILTRKLKEKFNIKELHVNDIVDFKLEINNISDKIKFILADAETYPFESNYDLVVSNASLQWFKDKDKFLNKVNRFLTPGALFAFTSFGKHNFKEIREFFNIGLDYLDFERIKNNTKDNFEIIYFEEFREVIDFKDPLELLKYIRSLGVSLYHDTQINTRLIFNFINENFNKQYTLTYHPLIVVLRKH